MLRLVTVLCLVGAALSMGMGGGEKFLKKYASWKIQESCLGKPYMDSWKLKMKAACDKCKGESTENTVSDIEAMIRNFVKAQAATRQNQMPFPFSANQAQHQFRNKRSSEWNLSPERLEMMKEKMMTKMNNMTCIMQELNIMTSDFHPNYRYLNEEINNLEIDQGMKEDFLESMDMCRHFAMCMPVDKFKHPMMKKYGPFMAFAKCSEMKKIQVCMKQDMKTYAPLMGYEGDVESEESDTIFGAITDMIFADVM